MEEVVIEGKSYIGYFEGILKSGTRWFGSEYYQYEKPIVWWEVEAVIKNKVDGTTYSFPFHTGDFREKNYWKYAGTLEKGLLLILDKGDYIKNMPSVLDIEGVRDCLLEQLVDGYKKFSGIKPKNLSFMHASGLELEALVKKGLMADKQGQIHMVI